MADNTVHPRPARDQKPAREPRPRTIYALTTAHDDYLPRYVGTTINDPGKRLQQHLLWCKRGSKYRVYRWVRARVEQGHEIIMLILERNVPSADAEIVWIKTARARCSKLMNILHGGCAPGEGKVLTVEHRSAISRGMRACGKPVGRPKGCTLTPEHRAKVSAGLLRSGRDYTEQAKKTAAKLTGRRLAPAHVAALKAAKRSPWTPEIRAARVAADATPEVKARRSAAGKRQAADPEARRKLAEAGERGRATRWGKPPDTE